MNILSETRFKTSLIQTLSTLETSNLALFCLFLQTPIASPANSYWIKQPLCLFSHTPYHHQQRSEPPQGMAANSLSLRNTHKMTVFSILLLMDRSRAFHAVQRCNETLVHPSALQFRRRILVPVVKKLWSALLQLYHFCVPRKVKIK